MRIKATIQVRGNPLRRAYVEHFDQGDRKGMYMTDLNGEIMDMATVKGIDSTKSSADIRIICQNPILRILDGNFANIGVYQGSTIVDGDTVNLNTNDEQDDYYAILNRAQFTYEIVFRQMSFFGNLPDPDFPLSKRSTLQETRDQAKRIDLIYPDHSVSPVAWVEPKRLGDNFPLMHIKVRTSDGTLFGEDGYRPTLIPHELAHALHFSTLSEDQRGHVQDKYAEFIVNRLSEGATHDFAVRTTPEVAYIEAAGWFGENFMQFMRTLPGGSPVRRQDVTPAIQSDFAHSEWIRLTTFPRIKAMIPYGNGVITAFAGGAIFSSPDGQNLGGGGNTSRVYSGNQTVFAMIAYRNGVITAFSGKGIYLSPDGQNLGGDGNTSRVYSGNQTVVMIPYRDGVITAFSGGGIYLSPDGQNLGGGGNTSRVYNGNQTVVAMIPYRNGVITAFSGKGIYLSPDGQNLGGDGNTSRVYSGNQTVVAMIPYRNGVITAFSGKGIYFSPDGQNLGGDGNTTPVYSGDQTVVAMIPYRDGVITAFSGRGIYFSPAGENLGGGGTTARVYSGNQRVVEIIPYRNGVITAFTGKGIYFSPNGRNLGGASNNTRASAAPTPRDMLQPNVSGGNVEGAVYGAIFADFASSVGLDFAVTSYFQANAINFDQYHEFINDQHPGHSARMEQVRRFWGL
jgi:hypothetical protein